MYTARCDVYILIHTSVNLPGECWAEIQQLALIGSSSSLHSEACNALGASDGVVQNANAAVGEVWPWSWWLRLGESVVGNHWSSPFLEWRVGVCVPITEAALARVVWCAAKKHQCVYRKKRL